MFGKKIIDDEVVSLIKKNSYYIPACIEDLCTMRGMDKYNAEQLVTSTIQTMRKKYGSRVNGAFTEIASKEESKIVSCPKCGSESITTTNKKISVGKGVAGAAVGAMINPVGTVVGAAVGATHSKKIYNVCMNCGHKWKP